MKRIPHLLLNLLVGLNGFILFFLLFESRIVLPPALQVVGRTHPLVLHFPIVLLVLVWLLACFGQKLLGQKDILQRLFYKLLLITALCAAFTVIAGLLLAQQDSYGGSEFQWHKWSGVALSFLTTALLAYYQYGGVKNGVFRPFFVVVVNVSVLLLLLTGHFGAGLTHGDDFLLAPIRRDKPQTLSLDTALVFRDLVYPVLQAKCMSCHNADKAKGELALHDTVSLLKGGEHGLLFEKGSPGKSLLVERLLLAPDHKHHMPPKGKPQLTAGELALVQAWIASGADFSKPLASYAADDTLYRLAAAIYGPAAEESYDFPAASAEAIAAVNNPYRSVRPLSSGSPALAVNFFGKAFYTETSLPELSKLSEQLVWLNLSGMPVSLKDMEVLKTFSNLRELNLNYTPVEDAWMGTIRQLPRLQSINLSGTKVTGAGLSSLLSSKTLRRVYAWNTVIPPAAVEKLGQQFRNVHIERGYQDDGSNLLPLSDPVIKPANNYFRGSAQVRISHPISGAALRYTLDGSEPDSVHSPIYKGPVPLRSDAVLRTKAYKKGWLSSREASRAFHRSAIAPDQVTLVHLPHPQYRGREGVSLFDLESGGANNADGKWLGFREQPLVAALHFNTPVTADTLSLSVKQDGRNSYIYPPERIVVWAGADSAHAALLLTVQPKLDKEASTDRITDYVIKGKNMGYMRIEAQPVHLIPKGFPGEGNPAWLFIDEIILK